MAGEVLGAELTLEDFYALLPEASVQPLWTQSRTIQPLEPAPSATPHLWRYARLRRLLGEAGRLVPIEAGGDRRVLALANPGLAPAPFAAPTLWAALQYLGPGESAPAHRHSQGAIRFLLEGEGAFTTVDGDACSMGPGDLVLTPGRTWHDHHNPTDHPVVWFDGLDLPLVLVLDASFFEPGGSASEVTGHDRSEAGADPGAGLVERDRPPGEDEAHSPLLVYRWRHTDAELSARMKASRSGSVTVSFASPATGRSVLPTLSCAVTRLAPGARTRPQRRTGSSVFLAWRGSGTSVIGGVEMAWSEGDCFVAPSWALVEHEARRPADLFSISDRPVLEALHLYREEEHEAPQPVTARFGD